MVQKFGLLLHRQKNWHAGVVELVDTLDLGSSVARLGGSSPFARTNIGEAAFCEVAFFEFVDKLE